MTLSNPTFPSRQGGPVTLAAALEQARAELAREQPPAAIRHALRADFARRHPRRRRPLRWLLSGAGVCLLLLAGSLVVMLVLPEPPVSDWERQALATGFVPVAPAERWPRHARDAGTAPAWVITTELPRERLATLGLPFDPARAGEPVRAQLLLHPSGDVLAVRVLR